MSSNDTYWEQMAAGHLANIDKRLQRLGNQAYLANAIAYLASGQATDEEAKALRAFVKKSLNLS